MRIPLSQNGYVLTRLSISLSVYIYFLYPINYESLRLPSRCIFSVAFNAAATRSSIETRFTLWEKSKASYIWATEFFCFLLEVRISSITFMILIVSELIACCFLFGIIGLDSMSLTYEEGISMLAISISWSANMSDSLPRDDLRASVWHDNRP